MKTPDGMYDTQTMIGSIIVDLNKVEVRGVENMALLIGCVQRLGALQKGLAEEERRRHEDHGERENL